MFICTVTMYANKQSKASKMSEMYDKS